MTVIIQARDPNDDSPMGQHKEVTGTYIPSDGEFALDVWIKGGSSQFHFDIDATKTREVWKEVINATHEEQIKALDVHPRTIELLEKFEGFETIEPNVTVNLNYTLAHFEHLSSILLRAYDANENLVNFNNINVTVHTMDGALGALGPYPLTSVTGQSIKKIAPSWVYEVLISVTVPNPGIYTLELHAERSYDVDTEIGDIEVEAKIEQSEAEPLNVEQHQTLVLEDVIYAEVGGTPVPLTDIAALFDKNVSNPYMLGSGSQGELLLRFKMPFRVKELAFPESYGGLTAVISLYPEGQTTLVDCGDGVFTIDGWISEMRLSQNSGQPQAVGELILTKFFETRVFPQDGASFPVEATEAAPLNVEQHQTLVSEDIVSIHKVLVNNQVQALTRTEIDRLFDKNLSDNYTLGAGQGLFINFKMPFRLKAAIALELGENFVNPLLPPVQRSLNMIWQAGLAREVDTPALPTFPSQYGQSATFAGTTPVQSDSYTCDYEVSWVYFKNPVGAETVLINQIYLEKFFDTRMFAQGGQDASERNPLNVEEHQTLVLEDIALPLIDGNPVPPNTIKTLFDKNTLTSGYVLNSGSAYDVWLWLKNPIRVKEILAVAGSNLRIGVNTKLGITYYTGPGPHTINDYVTEIYLANRSGSSLSIRELIVAKFFDTRVYATEAEPVNVEQHQTLVAEDITRATFNGDPIDPLLLAKFFDKDYTTPTDSESPGDVLELFLKIPFRLKEIKVIQNANLLMPGAQISYMPVETGVYVDTQSNIATVDAEVSRIKVTFTTAGTVTEIIAEKFFDNRVFPQEGGGIFSIKGGYKNYENDDLDNGETDILTVYSDLNRLGHDGYIINDGPDDLDVEISEDGTTYGDKIPVYADEILYLEHFSINKIRLTCPTVGGVTAYRVVVL